MTGITLPLISYGGTSVVVCILMIGVLNWLNTQLNDEEEPPIQENITEDSPCEDLE
jgi:hypothetical protein